MINPRDAFICNRNGTLYIEGQGSFPRAYIGPVKLLREYLPCNDFVNPGVADTWHKQAQAMAHYFKVAAQPTLKLAVINLTFGIVDTE